MGESIGVPVRSCMGCECLLIPIYQRTSHGTRPYVHSHPSLRLSDRSSACLPTPLVGGSDFMRVMAVPKQHSRTSAIPRPHASMSNTEFNSCASPVPSLVPLTLTPSHQHTPAFSVPVTTLAPSEYLPIRSLFRDPKGRHIIATPSLHFGRRAEPFEALHASTHTFQSSQLGSLSPKLIPRCLLTFVPHTCRQVKMACLLARWM